MLETEGVQDEEQAARLQELAEQIQKEFEQVCTETCIEKLTYIGTVLDAADDWLLLASAWYIHQAACYITWRFHLAFTCIFVPMTPSCTAAVYLISLCSCTRK